MWMFLDLVSRPEVERAQRPLGLRWMTSWLARQRLAVERGQFYSAACAWRSGRFHAPSLVGPRTTAWGVLWASACAETQHIAVRGEDGLDVVFTGEGYPSPEPADRNDEAVAERSTADARSAQGQRELHCVAAGAGVTG